MHMKLNAIAAFLSLALPASAFVVDFESHNIEDVITGEGSAYAGVWPDAHLVVELEEYGAVFFRKAFSDARYVTFEQSLISEGRLLRLTRQSLIDEQIERFYLELGPFTNLKIGFNRAEVGLKLPDERVLHSDGPLVVSADLLRLGNGDAVSIDFDDADRNDELNGRAFFVSGEKTISSAKGTIASAKQVIVPSVKKPEPLVPLLITEVPFTSFPTPPTEPVPEPTSSLLLALAGVLGLTRRSRA